MVDPNIATIIKDYATSSAIILAGVWGLWRWTYGEFQRRKREMASPDGTLTIVCVDLESNLVAATINAMWRNRGPLLIALCAEHTTLRVYRLSELAPVGPLSIHESTMVAEILPWWETYVMEPNTESLLQEHLALERDRVYAFRWRLCLPPGSLPGRLAKDHMSVRRDLIWKAPRLRNETVPAQSVPLSGDSL